MFEIPEGDLPIVRTRKALLILDIQNDFVASGGILPVDKPADYIEKILHLAPIFRNAGPIIWVRSHFETCRPVNDGSSNGDRIITDRELPSAIEGICEGGRRQRIPSKTMLKLYDEMLASNNEDEGEPDSKEAGDESDEPYDNEAYLTPELGKKPRCLLPLSLGANYAQPITQAIDLTKDLFFTKSHYSAFKSGALLQILRGQFVTELFICGALTNISVFATVMDAVQFGYSITLVEDCLGYRSQARHDEAIRQMIETTGCEVISSLKVIEAITAKEIAQNRPSNARRPVRDTHDNGNLHHMITKLKLRNDTSATAAVEKGSTQHPPEISSSKEVSESSTKAQTSQDSLQQEPSTSKDSLPDKPPLPKKPEGDTKKRVPNKIKTRRRLSKNNSNDKEQRPDLLKSSNSESSKMAKVPLSPTQLTLTSESEVLEKIPQASADEDLQGATTSAEQTRPTTAADDESKPRSSNIDVTDIVANEKQDTELENEVAAAEKKDFTVEGGTDASIDSDQLGKGNLPTQDPQSNLDEESFDICEGDSKIIHNLLPQLEAVSIFERVRDEVRWQKMSHQGGDVPRLVSVQGEISEDGSIPIYRHPADESPPLLPFTSAVSLIRSEVEKRLGHKVNHCLIQFYRDGTDYISEHSDKTLDITPNSFIANVSLGALRTMTFRTKRPLKDQQGLQAEENTPRLSCKVPLPHNSMCKMGLRTNMKWLHGIRQDKRSINEKSEAELAYDVGRISLTFRLIGTFLDRSQTRIWGQGAVAKEKKDARMVINGGTQAEKMLWAFGKENHSSDFDWQESYGTGFDVLHISNTRKLFLSGDAVMDLRVKVALSEFGLTWEAGELSPFFYWKEGGPHVETPEIPEVFPVRFVDNDPSRARAQGDLAILLYLDASYRSAQDPKSQVQKARQYTRLQQADTVLQSWRAKPFEVKPFRRLLALWDIYASEDLFIAGPTPSVADYAFWPVLHEVLKEWGDGIESPNLELYHDRMLGRESVRQVITPPASEYSKQ